MKRVLLTGASGFVGANLAQMLLNDGHDVYLFVREGFKAWRLEPFLQHVHLVKVNLLDPADVFQKINEIRPDWIFHLAAFGAYSWQDDLGVALQTNLLSTINLIEAARKVGFDAFINTGSSSEYGFKDHAPSENEYLEPNSYYAATKAAATLLCRYTAQRYKSPIFTLRLYSVYGPYEEPNRLIPSLITKGLKGGFPHLVSPEVARDFIFSEDVCAAYSFVASSANKLPFGSVYNVGTGIQTSVREIVSITKDVFSIPDDPVWGSMENRSWDTDIWVANNTKLCQAGWKPVYNFQTGYLKTIEWFKQNIPKMPNIYESSTL
jgi:UDP-glucose 4-epimerase